MGEIASTLKRRGKHSNNNLKEDKLLSALKYTLITFGTRKSVYDVSLTCKALQEFCFSSERDGSNSLRPWRTALRLEFPRQFAAAARGQRVGPRWSSIYKKLHLDWCRKELAYLRSREKIIHAIQQYTAMCSRGALAVDVIGLVPELVTFERADVCRCVSITRPQATNIVVMSSQDALLRFKLSRSKGVKVPYSGISYLTLDSDFRALCRSKKFPKSLADLPEVPVNEPGFLGYAINLIRLRPEHEYMRSGIFWTVFRNLMIFDSCQRGEDYARRNSREGEIIWTTGLDVRNGSVKSEGAWFPCGKFRKQAKWSRPVGERIRVLSAIAGGEAARVGGGF